MNLNLMPKETFVYDEVEIKELESVLDKVNFFNDMDVGISYERFIYSKGLKVFVPVATYDRAKDLNRLDETVSQVEGTVLPFFGFAYRPDKIQFSFRDDDGIDHGAHAIEHAQHLGNLLVDEARLSDNRYRLTNTETARLLTNYDIHTVDVVPDNSCYGADELVTTELYLF